MWFAGCNSAHRPSLERSLAFARPPRSLPLPPPTRNIPLNRSKFVKQGNRPAGLAGMIFRPRRRDHNSAGHPVDVHPPRRQTSLGQRRPPYQDRATIVRQWWFGHASGSLAVSSKVMNRSRLDPTALIEPPANGFSVINRRRKAARKIIVANCSRFRTAIAANPLPIR